MPTEPSNTIVVDTTKSPYAQQRPIPTTAVKLTDRFWQPRREINRTVTIPSQFKHLEETDRLNNFRRAAGRKDLEFVGIYFNDSDVYKWLEAAASALPEDSDGVLAPMVRTAIDVIAAAQESDGYLNTYFTYEKAADRWKNLKDMHELYCAGHLFQAAVAHYRSTGSDTLLNVARRFADNIDSVFGAPDAGKRPGACGHPEAEMALVELSRATNEPRYAALAQHMVDVHGQKPTAIGSGSAYHQDHIPFRELSEVIGHAVRMVYLAAGATDLYLESGEKELKDALDRQWVNRTQRRMYVSGGLGSRHEGEAFGKDYELPNARAYTETCAAIGGVMWDWRMLLATGEAKYADLIEHTLINAVLPGLSFDGQAYFYPNPLEADETYRRQPWFGCACCPPNVARLIAQLPGYFYTVTNDAISVQLYTASTAQIPLSNGTVVTLRQQTDYPWDGTITITTDTAGSYALRLRIPAWCEEGATLTVNGTPEPSPLTPDTYTEIRREWAAGDVVTLVLPMPVRYVEAHPHVTEDQGHIAVLRGPLLYCLEQADNPGIDPREVLLPSDPSAFSPTKATGLPDVTALTGKACIQPLVATWLGTLYRTVGKTTEPTAKSQTITLIPYYAWANREPGRMQVWLRRK
jgi:DUF1680 family protein